MADSNHPQKTRSLEEVHRSVQIPTVWWRRMFAFAGPAYLVSVGYMDPGNWATDIEGGAQFGYRLIWVLLMSNLMAVLLQTLSARLGLVTGRDLAQACYDDYPRGVNYILFVLCEIAIAACDLAEVLGSAIGLKLLSQAVFAMFGIDARNSLALGRADYRLRRAAAAVDPKGRHPQIGSLHFDAWWRRSALCFLVEIFFCKPDIGQIAAGFVPRPFMPGELYVAIGILGATVMPHNLYLHSALVQSRDVTRSREAVAQACRFNLIDSAVAMNAAFLVNAAILIVAAATFWTRNIEVTEIEQAHSLLELDLGIEPRSHRLRLGALCARAKVRRSPARWPARSRWKAFCGSASNPGCGG